MSETVPHDRNENVAKLFKAIPVKLHLEQTRPVEAEIRGEIPDWLTGSFLRNGPAGYELGRENYNHFFDGLGLLHRWHINNGSVTYQNKFVRSESFNEAVGRNRVLAGEFGTRSMPDPCKSMYEQFMSYFVSGDQSDNDLVSLFRVGEEFYATSETNYIRKIDPRTLDSAKHKVNYSNVLAVNGATAHALYDSDGTVYNMGTKYGLYSSYNIIKVPPPDKGVQDNPLQKASIVCTIPMSNKHPSYYHSFGMTDNYFIYVEQPLILNIWKLVIMKIMGYTFADCMEFHKDWPTRIHLCNRETSQLTEIKYIADALFLFHHVNAYEDNGHMVIDIFAYEDDLIMKRMYMKVAQDGHDLPLSRPYRFVLPLYIPKNTKVGVNFVTLDNCQATAMLREDGSVYCHHELLFDPNIIAEFPRINYDDCNGKKYRYFYSSGRDLMQLLKYDLEKRTIKAWKEDDMFGSEPVFIAKPGATKEDEGVVISSVLSGDEKKSSFLLILDGESFEEIGRAVTPAHVQNSFGGHGLFDFTIN